MALAHVLRRLAGVLSEQPQVSYTVENVRHLHQNIVKIKVH